MSNSNKTTISTYQLFEMFPTQEAARMYLEDRRWPTGVLCPICNTGFGPHLSIKYGSFCLIA